MLIHSPNDLALFVRTHRKKNKLSQAALAESVGLKQTTISAFEQNPERTKMDTLFRILSAAGIQMTVVPKSIDMIDSEW